jgi:hypothetical protein
MTSSVARALAGLGAAVALTGTLLHFVDDASIWQIYTRADIFLAAICVASLLLSAAASIRPNTQLDRMLIASAGAGLGIEGFLAVERYYVSRQAGFFLIAGAAVIQAIALILMVVPERRSRPVGVAATPSAASPARFDERRRPEPGGEAGTYGEARPPALPPAGWYPDPAGSAGERYWDGAAWTERTQPLAGR